MVLLLTFLGLFLKLVYSLFKQKCITGSLHIYKVTYAVSVGNINNLEKNKSDINNFVKSHLCYRASNLFE